MNTFPESYDGPKSFDIDAVCQQNVEHISTIGGEYTWTGILLNNPDNPENGMHGRIEGVIEGENRDMLDKLYSTTEAQIDEPITRIVTDNKTGNRTERTIIPLKTGANFMETTLQYPDGSAISAVSFFSANYQGDQLD